MDTTAPRTVVVTGASSGFGALTVRALADADHTVHAGMRDTAGRNARAADDARTYADEHGVVLRPVEMDVVDEAGRVDVVVHDAGHMVLGPTEAFTPEQLAQVRDTNVLSAQRVNRAVLPHLRAQRDGLVVRIGSSSSRGGTPPYLAPYFAAEAGMDALAVSYAAELAQDPSEVARAVVFAVGDRVRAEFYRRVGLEALLAPVG